MGDLAERVARLEDIEALRQLKYRYCAAVDDNYDAEAVAALFTEDGVWDGGALGRYEGRAAIIATFNSVKDSLKLVQHMVANPLIEVSGDTAHCRWCLMVAKIAKDGGSATVAVGTYDDLCRRRDGRWLIERLTLTMTTLP
jgi:uncharacterized protein (TIGR02246 family)